MSFSSISGEAVSCFVCNVIPHKTFLFSSTLNDGSIMYIPYSCSCFLSRAHKSQQVCPTQLSSY